MDEHPGHHECLPGLASQLTAERFLDLIENHEELHDLFRFSTPEGLEAFIHDPEENL